MFGILLLEVHHWDLSYGQVRSSGVTHALAYPLLRGDPDLEDFLQVWLQYIYKASQLLKFSIYYSALDVNNLYIDISQGRLCIIHSNL
jgi:hypothetical protein